MLPTYRETCVKGGLGTPVAYADEDLWKDILEYFCL